MSGPSRTAPSAGSSSLPVTTIASPSATPAFAAGNVYAVTLDKNIAPTLSGSGSTEQVVKLQITQDATGGRTVTWPGSVTWLNGVVPAMPSGAGQKLWVNLESVDGGTTWQGDAGGNAIEAWHVVGGGGEISFQNSFVNVGGSFTTLRYAKTASGLVIVEGSVMSGTAGTAVCSLPPGYRPLADFLFAVWGLVGGTYTLMQGKILAASGNLVVNSATTPIAHAAICLTFRAEQ